MMTWEQVRDLKPGDRIADASDSSTAEIISNDGVTLWLKWSFMPNKTSWRITPSDDNDQLSLIDPPSVHVGDVFIDNDDADGYPFAKVTKVDGDYVHVSFHATGELLPGDMDDMIFKYPDDRFTKLTVPTELYMLRHGDSDEWVLGSREGDGYVVYTSLGDANDAADYHIEYYDLEIKPIVVRVK